MLLNRDGPELLQLVRKPTFNEEVDTEISALVNKLVDRIISSEPAPAPPTRQKTDLLDKLWVLKNAYIEIGTLAELGELLPALQAAEKLKTANLEFGAQNPGALIVNDISEKLDLINEQLYKQVTALWHRQVSIKEDAPGAGAGTGTGTGDGGGGGDGDGTGNDDGDGAGNGNGSGFGTGTDSASGTGSASGSGSAPTSITVAVSPDFAENWDLYQHCEPRLKLIEGFVAQFNTLMLETILNLRVDDVGETETSASLGLGETKSVEMLVYNVQTLVLALSSVLPQDLYKNVAGQLGYKFVRQLVAKSLPMLSPSDPQQLPAFKNEIQGIKGLEELLISVDWYHGHVLSDYAENFESLWKSQREAVYLNKLRKSLSGKYQSDSWDWDGEDDEDQEDPQEDPQQEVDPPASVIKAFVAETEAKIDNMLILFRALAPKYYGDHLIELYAATRELHAQVNALPYSGTAYSNLEAFGAMQLDLAVDNFSAGLDKILHQPPSAGTASKLAREVERIAQTTSAGGPQIRDNVLSTLCEQICVYTVKSTLAFGDITQDQADHTSQFIKGLRGLNAFFSDINDQVPSWIKMQRLEQLLNQNLMGIRGMYDNSMLEDFSGQELVNLVEALFVDSDAREDLIQRVGRA